MTGFCLSAYYGYGAARMLLPLNPPRRDYAVDQTRYFRPFLIAMVSLLIVIGGLRICAVKETHLNRTVLWLHKTPEKIEVDRPVVVARTSARKYRPDKPKIIPKTKVRPEPTVTIERKKFLLAETVVQPVIKKKAAHGSRQTIQGLSHPELAVSTSIEPLSRNQSPSDQRAAVGPVAASDFTPLTLSEMPDKPVRATGADAMPDYSILLVSGKERAVADGSAAISHLAVASTDGCEVFRRARTVPPPERVTLDLPSASSVAVAEAEPDENLDGAEGVDIVGVVQGESTRIENLKRMIFKKASQLESGFYCCRITTIDCRLMVTPDQPIRVFFSRDVIPFEIVSRLERHIPEGLEPCAE